MASTALPHQQQQPHHQLSAGAESPDSEVRPPPPEIMDPPSSTISHREGSSSPPTHHSATSGSNSEDEEREHLLMGKRLGGFLQGLVGSKKRRKQSKPIRLGSDAEPGQVEPTDQDAARRPSEEVELEDGERRRHMPEEEDEDGAESSPLNLSSERPGLRVLGQELMTQTALLQSMSGGMSGENGVSAATAKAIMEGMPGGIPASLYQGMMNPFGMPPFPFPFPGGGGSPGGQQGPPTIVGKGSIPGSGGRMQIFNPEAYCELCNKEFCNKYFLKTHKANKHGIYSDPPTSSANGGSSNGAGARSPGPSNGHMQMPQLPQQPVSLAAHTPGTNTEPGVGPPTPNSQAGSPFSGAFIAQNMGALRPPFVPLSPGASPSPQQQQHNQGKEPGQLTNGDNNRERDGSPRMSDMPMPMNLLSPRDNEEAAAAVASAAREELRRSLESPRSAMSALPPHFNPLLFGGLPSLDSLRKPDDMSHKEQGISRSIPNIPNLNNLGGGGQNAKGPFNPDKLRQMGVINADAFCEICCKEFCNKYFLRVHKLKKHGICSPDLPPEKVQKILNQMAKEAGKTGNPPPPIIRPPVSVAGLSPSQIPLPRTPGQAMMQLPPLEPLLPQQLQPLTKQQLQSAGSSPSLLFSQEPRRDSASSPRDHQQPQMQQDGDIIRINDDSEDGLVGMRGEGPGSEENGSGKASGKATPSSTNAKDGGQDLQRLQSMIMELNSGKAKVDSLLEGSGSASSICKICNKDMDNKYFLRAHMMNDHGVLQLHPTSSAEEPPQLQVDPKDSPASGTGPSEEEKMIAAMAANPFAGLMNGDMMPGADFATKFLQQMQKGFGGIGAPPTSMAGMPGLDTESELSFLERVKSELAVTSANAMVGGMTSPGKKLLLSQQQQLQLQQQLDRDPNRKPASLSRSYCEICKKELCNKYFMKTHMMKMHGINIDAAQTSGVKCNLCGKELCSKYFLKVHLQNSHGIVDEGGPIQPPPPGAMKENGGGLFGGLFPPPPEMLGGPPPTSTAEANQAAEHYFSRLLGEQSELSREKLKEFERQKQMGEEGSSTPSESGAAPSSEAGHTCSLCGDAFPEIVALQVHIIKQHGAFPPETGFFGSGQGSKAASEAGGDNNKEETADGSKEENNDSKNEEEDAMEEGETPRKKRAMDDSSPVGPATPTSAAPSFSFPSMEGAVDKFPNIEMLQRHMLSQQFPGLMAPFLQGLPGFPGGAAATQSLSQLLGGSPMTAAASSPSKAEPVPVNGSKSEEEVDDMEVEEGLLVKKDSPLMKTPPNSKPAKANTKSGKMSYKCSKCQEKFPQRALCLAHIQTAHALKRRPQQPASSFSPKHGQAAARTQQRAHYVRQLMELLRVPTTRGTAEGNTAHIMQPFLLKAGENEDDGAAVTSSPSEDPASSEPESNVNFVPSLVYLPVAKRVSQPLTVAFNLTPA